MSLDSAFNLAAAIVKANEYLKDDPPLRRAFFLLVCFLVIGAAFYEYRDVTEEISVAVETEAPPWLPKIMPWLLSGVASALAVGLTYGLTGQRRKPAKLEDYYSPIREELVKLRHWKIELNEFYSDRSSKHGYLQLNIDEKMSKLSLRIQLLEDVKVDKEASDISLRVRDQNSISLLFYVDGLAGGTAGDIDGKGGASEFEYLFCVSGGQISGQPGLKMTGEWYRLAGPNENFRSRGNCEVVALV